MWFVYVGVGLALLIACGIYVRRRIGDALAHFGVSSRAIRIMRWVVAWLLFGFPILVVVSIVASLLLGRATLPRFDSMAASLLLAVPFMWAVLVVLQSGPWLIAIDLANRFVRRDRLRAIAVLAVVGAFAAYIPIRILVERGDVRVRQHVLGTGGAPFRIAFVADIQQDVHTTAARAREVYAIINASKPDVVLSGGDWINAGPDHIEAAAVAAATLTSRLGTFSVRGDHEHFAYVDRERSVGEVERAMQARGIAMLNNEVRWFEHAGKRIAVLFLNYNYIVRTDEAEIEKLVASIANADYSIVVTHQLDRALAPLLESKVDLVLAAHTHGGQINPVVGFMHVKLARLETRFVDGRYALGSTTVIVTAGVGYSMVPFRYASPGSIELVELRL
ncbi:MAG: metallophosphoesterase [Myxococcota bacterium]|nr:metallophosphoesterase [Deltaproteobacteria bacterium]MDQ3338394.1 metallophosphoesterase [Myxococcota bacterium]